MTDTSKGRARPPRALVGAPAGRGRELRLLFRGGVLRPGRPDRVVRRLGALARYGPSLAGAFAAAAARDPNGAAVVDDERSVTFGELDARVRRLAAGLAAFGVGPGAGVAVLQGNSIYAVEALVAASRTGADALLLSPFLAPDEVTEMLRRESPKAVVVDAELSEKLLEVPADMTVIVGHPGDGSVIADASLDELAGRADPDLPPPSRPGRMLVLASGTTGPPKVVRRGPATGRSAPASVLSRLDLRPRERMLIAPPLFHTWGLDLLQLAPALGSTIVLRRRPDAEAVLAAVQQHRCTSAIVVPQTARRMVDLDEPIRSRYDTSSLRVVASGGGALSEHLGTRFLDTFGDVLHNVYGTAEVSWAAVATPADLRKSPGTAGRPPMGTRLALLNRKGRPVRLGEVGTIFAGNETVFEGYTDGSDRPRSHGLVYTGDRGVIDEDGLLRVLGRNDDRMVGGPPAAPSA